MPRRAAKILAYRASLESKNLPFSLSNFTFPKGKSLLKMSAIVVSASFLSGYVINSIEQKA